MVLLSLSTSSRVNLPYFFKRPLLISALTFWICAPLGNILKNTILTVSSKSPPPLKKSLNCMVSNMSPVALCSKFSKCVPVMQPDHTMSQCQYEMHSCGRQTAVLFQPDEQRRSAETPLR